MSAATLLPLAAWGALFGAGRCQGLDWRGSFLLASLLWGLELTLLTESLSLFALLNAPALAAGWAVCAAAAGVAFWRSRGNWTRPALPRLAGTDRFMLLALAGVLALTLAIALIAPPNNKDSLAYHMSRVMHWAQQGSVAHYPTHVLRQLELNPWAEFAILHFQLLSGADYLANLVQWFSMAGCIIGVSSVAALFGAPLRGQLIAALAAGTIPMAILQASSTQNDLALSFWLVCLVYFGIRSLREQCWHWHLLMALSLGLAILTKGTAYIFAFPLMLWFFLQELKHSGGRSWLKYLVLALVVLSLNLGHYQRNYRLFGNPLHSGSDNYSNGYLSAQVVLSNVSRNLALHLLTPLPALNDRLVGGLESWHALLGLAIDDPATTWPGTTLKGRLLAPHEDSSGNPLHLALMLAVAGLALFVPCPRELRPYGAALCCAFLLFCLLLRWQPWHSRLQLPLFVLFAPIAGTVIAAGSRAALDRALVGVLSVAALPWIFCNVSRPIITLSSLVPGYPASILAVPRHLQYFAEESCIGQSYLDAASFIAGTNAREIGLKSGVNGREYPIWVLTRTSGLAGPRIEHVEVKNVSATIKRKPVRHDLVVVLTSKGKSCEASIAPSP